MNKEFLISSVKNSLINIHDVSYCEKNTSFGTHIHDEYEFYYVISGKKIYYINEKQYNISEGEICFVNANIPHRTETPEGGLSFILQFSPDSYNDNTGRTLSHFINYLNCDGIVFKKNEEVTDKLINCFENIIEENKKKDRAFDFFIKSEVYKILAILYRYNIIKNPDDFYSLNNINQIMPALKYIDKNYNKHISLDEICSLININKFYFCKLFKKAVNTTFTDYTNFVRICKSEKILLQTDCSIEEVAEKTGFYSAAYFIKNFKFYKECTPNQYRKYRKMQ